MLFWILLLLTSAGLAQTQSIPFGITHQHGTCNHVIHDMAQTESILAPAVGKANQRSTGHELFVTFSGSWTSSQRKAFRYAVGVWNSILYLTADVEIKATLSDLGEGRLGGAAPAYLVLVRRGEDLYWVPGALGNQVQGADVSKASHEITLSLGTGIDWYYGTDGRTPRQKVDFVSVVMHEICHGLGFFGSAKVGNSCGNSELGCYGRQSQTGDVYPWYYDQFVMDRRGRALVDLPNYSSSLKSFLEGGSGRSANRSMSGNLAFSGPSTDGVELFTPSQWMRGSSYTHFDDRNEMMYYAFGRGHAKHHPGRALNVLKDLGYTIAPALLPIQLEDFVATTISDQVELQWKTSSELSSSHFEIQRSADGLAWETLDHIEAQGYALTETNYKINDHLPLLGTNFYRLEMTDQDGSSEFSSIQRADIAKVSQEVLVYPTPTSDILYLQRRAAMSPLRYQIISPSGGVISTGTTEEIKEMINVSYLAPGYYVLHCASRESQSSHRFLKN